MRTSSVRAVHNGGRGDRPRLVGGLWITTVAVHGREWAPVDSLVYFRQPHHGQELVCIGASSFGTKQWWKDFTDYQFEGVRNFDSFIGIIFLVHSFFYSVFILFFLLVSFSRCSAAFARGGMLEFIDSELGACAYL